MERKKVAILGYTPTRKDAPYDDPEWEIWGLNDLYRFKAPDDVKRWDRWFEFHDERLGNRVGRADFSERMAEFAKWNIPVYLQKARPDVPCSVTYPLDEAIERFGNYFTNTISYMIALAIMEGFEEIGIYGVDMSTAVEYAAQRPSCEYYLGIAKGKGMKVTVHPAADLLKARFLYGYETQKENEFKAKLKNMNDTMEHRKQQAEEQAKQAERVSWQYDGAISAVKEIERLWDLGGD